tara:strand:- start:1165 stop:2910 length:1746 start_codon:yes stop_codon:yes gene_type:complete
MQVNEDEENSYQFINDEFDIKEFILFLIRNRAPILLSSLLGLFISLIYAFSTPKIWLGQFQIVLEDKENSVSGLGINNRLLSISGINANNSLDTEVEILKSPSILIDVFKFVQKKDNSQYEFLRFNDWENNLEVKLKRGTSVLDIQYKDTNKDNVLPVLKEISSKYQSYAELKRSRDIELGKNYLENQIKIYKEKSNNSLRKVQEHSIDQDLIFIDIKNQSLFNNLEEENDFNRNTVLTTPNFLLSNVDIEKTRIKAANRIRRIDLELKKINSLKDDISDLIYFGSTIPTLTKKGLPQKVEQIEDQLYSLRKKYTDNDDEIIKLVKDREDAIYRLRNKSINYLKAEKLQAQAEMEASMRPKEVLLKYKELMREAARDESTLIRLENQLRLISLEESKISDPWQLITSPSIFPTPIWPSKKNIVIMGFTGSLFLGLILSCFIEKIKGNIYSFQLLKIKFKNILLLKLDLKDKPKWQQKINLLISGKTFSFKEDFAILYLGEINKDILNVIEKSFSKNLKNTNFIVTNNFAESSKYLNNLILLPLGKIKHNDLVEFQELTNIKKTNIIAGIVIGSSQVDIINN